MAQEGGTSIRRVGHVVRRPCHSEAPSYRARRASREAQLRQPPPELSSSDFVGAERHRCMAHYPGQCCDDDPVIRRWRYRFFVPFARFVVEAVVLEAFDLFAPIVVDVVVVAVAPVTTSNGVLPLVAASRIFATRFALVSGFFASLR